MMKVLNMLYICGETLIHMFLMYCLLNQTVLELHVIQLIAIMFHGGYRFIFDIF